MYLRSKNFIGLNESIRVQFLYWQFLYFENTTVPVSFHLGVWSERLQPDTRQASTSCQLFAVRFATICYDSPSAGFSDFLGSFTTDDGYASMDSLVIGAFPIPMNTTCDAVLLTLRIRFLQLVSKTNVRAPQKHCWDMLVSVGFTAKKSTPPHPRAFAHQNHSLGRVWTSQVPVISRWVGADSRGTGKGTEA